MDHFLKNQSRGIESGVSVTALLYRPLGFLSFKPPTPRIHLSSGACHISVISWHHWASRLNSKKGEKQREKKPCHVNLLFLLTGKTKTLSESIPSPFLFTSPALVSGLKAICRPVPDTGQWDHSDWFRLSHHISWGWRRDPLSTRSRCCHMLLNHQIHNN